MCQYAHVVRMVCVEAVRLGCLVLTSKFGEHSSTCSMAPGDMGLYYCYLRQLPEAIYTVTTLLGK